MLATVNLILPRFLSGLAVYWDLTIMGPLTVYCTSDGKVKLFWNRGKVLKEDPSYHGGGEAGFGVLEFQCSSEAVGHVECTKSRTRGPMEIHVVSMHERWDFIRAAARKRR